MTGKEIWKEIYGYDGMYEVSNLGQVRSYHGNHQPKLAIPRILAQGNTRGYRIVNLPRLDRPGRYCPFVHHLVIRTFIGPKPDGVERWTVNHKDLDKANNRVENLEWMTHADNNRHATGKIQRHSIDDRQRRADGTLLPDLTAADVRRIREVHDSHLMSYAELAKAFGISKNYVWLLVTRQRRAEVH